MQTNGPLERQDLVVRKTRQFSFPSQIVVSDPPLGVQYNSRQAPILIEAFANLFEIPQQRRVIGCLGLLATHS